MPLVSIAHELERAQAGHYALPLFDTFDTFTTEGMLAAAEEKRAGMMIALYAGTLERPNARAFAQYIRERAEDATVPISLMLDHGRDVPMCVKALRYGFTDVMLDASKLPLEENIAQTRTVVQVAHACGAAVEAELGHVGSGSEYQEFGAQRKGFTDPETVERFVAETGVDFLAIAIGTAHGLYAGDPHLDMELLADIRSRVSIPLVLHGGSGCSDEQFRTAIAAGISKINITTDLIVTTGNRLVEAVRSGEPRYFDLSKVALDSFKERCCHYLDVFGTTGTS